MCNSEAISCFLLYVDSPMMKSEKIPPRAAEPFDCFYSFYTCDCFACALAVGMPERGQGERGHGSHINVIITADYTDVLWHTYAVFGEKINQSNCNTVKTAYNSCWRRGKR